MTTSAHVLIVDDEPNGLYTLEILLSPDCYRISFAKDGQEALSSVAADPPDVILLDVMMPDLSGYEVCKRLKSSPDWQHIPIILVTALSQPTDLVQGFNSGADEFLTKPVEGMELRTRVRSMLRIKRQYDALQETLTLRQNMADMIVHDMRNPVSNILLYTDLLSYGKKSRLSHESIIEIIQQQGLRLNNFISDLLITAKMSSGHLVLNLDEVDMRDLLKESCRNYEAQAAARNITIELDLPVEKCQLEVDNRLMERTIQNLVSNAVKYSQDGGRIILRVRSLDSSEFSTNDKPKVCVEVIDEGIGIPENEHDLIFTRYGVVPNAPREVVQTGLGLALCKMVADAHGGQISVRSNCPQGTIMTLEL